MYPHAWTLWILILSFITTTANPFVSSDQVVSSSSWSNATVLSANCSTHPCLHGVCLDDEESSDRYRCFCLDGFTGKHCEHNFDECAPGRNRCQNSKFCILYFL